MSSNGFVFCSGPGVGVGERMFSENKVRMAETVSNGMSDMIDCSQLKVEQKWVAGRYEEWVTIQVRFWSTALIFRMTTLEVARYSALTVESRHLHNYQRR